MQSFIPLITGSAGALVVLAVIAYMFFADKIHSDGEFRRIIQALDDEKAAHARTREALVVANARAEAGLIPAKIIATVLGAKDDA